MNIPRRAPLRAAAFVLLVLVTGATSIGCTAAAGKVSTAEMPAPAADPVVVSSSQTSWADFLTWATGSSDDVIAILNTFSDDATAYDFEAATIDAAMLDSWASDAHAWLDSHEPESCYAAVHASYGRVADHMGKAGSLLKDGMTTSRLTAATAEMKLGTAEVNKATALVKKVVC